MTTTVFIGDEVTAAGFRLAGVQARVPDEGSEAEAFAAALEEAGLLIVTASCAARVPVDVLRGAQLRAEPLIAIVPDAANLATIPDLSNEVDRILGIAS